METRKSVVLFVAILTGFFNYTEAECRVYYKIYRTTTESTGFWRMGTRYRKLSFLESRCCTGYQLHFFTWNCQPVCAGSNNIYSSCHTDHGRSGGVCERPNKCASCHLGYYSNRYLGKCSACPYIPNCEQTKCSRPSDVTCIKCTGEEDPERPECGLNVFSGFKDRKKCRRQCSWKPGYRCFPGSCSGNMTIDTACKCADGFQSGNKICSSATRGPEITTQILTLRNCPQPEICEPAIALGETSETLWVNVASRKLIEINVSAIQNLEKMEPPNYIQSYRIGVAYIEVLITTTRSETSSSWKGGPTACSFKDLCKYNTLQQLGTMGLRIVENGFQHLDVLQFKVTAKNGGYVIYSNKDYNHSVTQSYYINGKTTERIYDMKFDFQPPMHCVENRVKCHVSALNTNDDYLTQETLYLTWDGWNDADSGISEYYLDLYTTSKTGGSNGILEKSNPIKSLKYMGTQKSGSMSLDDPGTYIIEITAFDKARNNKTASRIFLYDDAPKVELHNETMKVTNADTATGWIKQDVGYIELVWADRFINQKHDVNCWLCSVKRNDEIILELDDMQGVSARTHDAIHNIHGVVRFEVGYNVTYDGSYMFSDFQTMAEHNFDEQKIVYSDISIDDGKRLIFYVKGFDVMGSFAEDNVTTWIDKSPPVIDNLWLTTGDVTNVSVHNTTELNKLTIEWLVYDVHSGLHEISWKIFDNYTGSFIEHGFAHEPPQGDTETIEECSDKYKNSPRGANCYCSPFNGCFNKHFQVKPQVTNNAQGLKLSREYGEHESDYYIEIKAVNNAGLITVHHHKITIDISPPHAGHVHDGQLGYPEVDYQQSLTLFAHWDDFFDMESGVWFYMYGFGKTCLDAADLDFNNPGVSVNKTYGTNVEYDAGEPGTYYITVVAFNHGLDNSEAVCSDGITIDNTTTRVTDVVVWGALVAPTILKDKLSNNVYVLNQDRQLQEINNPSKECLEKAIAEDFKKIALFPTKRTISGAIRKVSTKICEGIQSGRSNMMSFVTTDDYLDISWNVTTGPSGVHDFEIGIASVPSIVPDKMPFRSTNQHQFTRIYHPSIWDGQQFYFILRSTSKASVSDIQTVGPFIVLKDKPDFSGILNIELETFKQQMFLVASWTNHSFIDHGDINDLDFYYAIGTKKENTDIKSFGRLSSGGSCRATDVNPTCTAINIASLQWSLHESKSYYVTIKAVNTIGLFVLASSEKYTHYAQHISPGIVHDIDPTDNTLFLDIDDIDFQTDVYSLSARWAGFHHPHSIVTYEVCVVEESSTYTVCANVGSSSEHTFTGLNLTSYKTYYQRVTAMSEVGNVTSISDGVTIVIENDTHTIQIFDGLGCRQGLVSRVLHNNSHHDRSFANVCKNDIDYQSSTNVLEAHWDIPSNQTRFMQDIMWAIEERAIVVDHWTLLQDFQLLKTRDYIKEAGLFLESGRRYRIAVKMCAKKFCFSPVYSNGTTVIHNSPETGAVDITYNASLKTLNVSMDMFKDVDIEEAGEATDVMHCYEWAISDNSDNSRILDKWRLVNVSQISGRKIVFEISLEKDIQFTKCWKLLIMGHTKAGLSTTVSADIKNCSNILEVHPSVVIDAVGLEVATTDDGAPIGGPIFLEENNAWFQVDIDYTPYVNILSAIWPTLRHKQYEWAVLAVTEEDPSIFYKNTRYMNLHQPCSHPDTIACGHTEDNFMNAEFASGELQHGHRYIVCVHANATEIRYEYWTQSLEKICACSSGVTVDLTPPEPADIWIGNNKTHYFQTSRSDMVVYWNSFADVEEDNFVVHQSGILSYQVALGTSPGGNDIVDYTDVGLTNHKVINKLSLQNGHSYFASVKGFDFIGHSSIAISHQVTVDSTPPTVTGKVISIPTRHIRNTSYVSACWDGVFADTESGLGKYYWSIGTNHGYEDVMEYTYSEEECADTQADMGIDLTEGHAYFITVKAYNKAGLFTTSTSWAVMVDESPPSPGIVYDGPRGHLYHDVDYVTTADSFSAHWTIFADAHTTVKQYSVAIGTCKGCKDVMPIQYVGLDYDIDLNMMKLAEGIKYFTTVEACNTADLCTSVSSDGFLVDKTAPIKGRVFDGIGGKEIQHQSSRTFVGCKWYGFVDSQSGISHYVWRLGTSGGGDNIVPPTCVHRQEEAFIVDVNSTLGKLLPVGSRIYCTVRAYNGAGMFTEATSNGFTVDSTAPIFSEPLSISPVGTVVDNSLILRSSLKIQWNVDDLESNIEDQYLSISSHIGGDFNASSMRVCGITRSYIFTDLDLHDGSYYDINIATCNMARLCTLSKVDDVIVDSSPPTMGAFAIDTNHAADLRRQPEGWMKWNSISLFLSWLGFEDIHSGIDYYMVNVGSTYMANDLNSINNVAARFNHSANGFAHDEGIIQTNVIRTNSLLKLPHVFVSIYATNKVGLRSPVLHGQFKLIYGGTLELVRRCEANSCNGHCVCAPHGNVCDHGNRTCRSNIPANLSQVLVHDSVDVRIEPMSFSERYSPVDTYLSASWKLTDNKLSKPQWYEWSVGESQYDSPLGVFDINENRYWHDAGTATFWIYSLPRESKLKRKNTYSFFVRAWYDENTNVVYKSPGVTILSQPPKSTNLRGASVKEVLGNSLKDVDYVTPTSAVKADWSMKFIANDIAKFHLYIGTNPGGNDVCMISNDISATTTSFNISGLPLQEDTIYYTVVQAFNYAGFHHTVSSDGFNVDSKPPVIGVVNDGKVLHDIQFMNTTKRVTAFWHGFADIGSGIDAYEHCISTRKYLGRCDIHPVTNVGLNTMIEVATIQQPEEGQELISEVRAYDMAGLVSSFAQSDGFVVDNTPPVRVTYTQEGKNLLHDYSFEEMHSIESSGKCVKSPSYVWKAGDNSCIMPYTLLNPADGHTVVRLQGVMYQSINITTPGKFSLEFYTSNMPVEGASLYSMEGYFEIGDTSNVFMMHSKPGNGTTVWQKHYFVLWLSAGQSNVSFGNTRFGNSFGIDNINLQRLSWHGYMANSSDIKHMKAFSVFSHDWSSIHADWSFEDLESGIAEYLWAIGTVKGGTQIQDFMSVGKSTFAFTDTAQLVHNTSVFVTAVAVNGAGLRTVSYSNPLLIDLTPPSFAFVYDGNNRERDEDFQTHLRISAHWSVSDLESSIKECYWAIGTSPHDTSVRQFGKVNGSIDSASMSLDKLPTGRIFTTVRCFNGAGLSTTATSDGIRILNASLSIHEAFVEIMSESKTQYPPKGLYHGDSTEVKFRWTGFGQEEGINTYIVALSGTNMSLSETVVAGTYGFNYASFTDIKMEEGIYEISVGAINEIQMYSQKKKTTFQVLVSKPELTGMSVHTLWEISSRVASASWAGVFKSDHPLYYEVTVRQENGEGDIVQWQETTNTVIHVDITADTIPETGVTLWFSIRAINNAGYFETITDNVFIHI